ncbi:forkhead box protein F-like [Ruditapes philippinarum]|uniref:forkhead box protein F-like n=1 Tax=Ruditapes philippinarum TaxID=129788 RepID=UPI00295B9472|nr:forkhead box protein F-like [Ruditapes philippinarum]
MDNILGIERHCYSPRHSTPAKDLCNTLPHQTSETENLLQSNVTVNYGQYPTFTMNSLLKATNQNEAMAHPTVYKRQEDKPPYTYVAMIIVAILNSEEKGLTLAGIRDKLTEMFPFFSGEYTGWKSSIRHALSNSKCFYKIQKRDNQDTLTVYVWKVNTKFVKSYTFNRQSKGPKYESYKFTLQEELGLPPFEYPSTDDSLGKDIKLPPKPCFHSDSVSLAGSVSEDFLNARNDSVPTPMSVISDVDSAPSSVSDNKPSLKRKRNEDITSSQQTAPASKRQTTYYNYPHYGYQQYPQSAYHPTYYGSSYHNSTPLSVGDQWSRDYNQYVYPQQYSAQTMNVNAYSNEILAMRNLWWSYYNGMVPSNSHLPQNTNDSDRYPSTPINMTKCDEKQSE